MANCIFQDRKQAGQLLGQCLRILPTETLRDAVVVALPTGGVPVGFEISKVLQISLETLIVRKIEHPKHEGFSIGAVAEGGISSLYEDDGFGTDISGEIVQELIRKAKMEIKNQVAKYRDGKSHTSFRGRTVILVTDGLESGLTAKVAAAYCRLQGARAIILAVPVCSQKTVVKLQSEVDVLICLTSPHYFAAVGYSYMDFHQVSDDEVMDILGCKVGKVAQV